MDIFIAAASAVSQVLILASAGAALELTGQMGPARRAALSNVAFRVFLPCLLFTNVAESASIDALRKNLSIPLFTSLYLLIGYILGAIVAPFITKPGDAFSKTHVIFACALNNVGYLPLILVPATLYQGALHEPGTDLVMEVRRGVSHIGLAILVLNISTWGLAAVSLRKVAAKMKLEEEEKLAHAARAEKIANGQSEAEVEAEEEQQKVVKCSSSGSTSSLTKPELLAIKLHTKYSFPLSLAKFIANIYDAATNILNPPVSGALCGLVIGLIPPFRALFFASPPLGLIGAPISSSSSAVATAAARKAVAVAAAANGDTSLLPAAPHFAALFGSMLNANAIASGMSKCVASMSMNNDNNNAGALVSSIISNSSGWYMCVANSTVAASRTIVSTASSSSCCVAMATAVSAQVFVSPSTPSSSDCLINAASGNITSSLFQAAAAGIGNMNTNPLSSSSSPSSCGTTLFELQHGRMKFEDILMSSILNALESSFGINNNNYDATTMMTSSMPKPTAPLGPTLTSAMQAFAAAIIPVVAITLGSNIVAPPEPKSTSPPSSSSSITTSTTSSEAVSISSTQDNDTSNDGTDITEIRTPSSSSSSSSSRRVLHHLLTSSLRVLHFIRDVAIGLDPLTGKEVVSGKVIGAIAFVRLIFMPFVGIVLLKLGTQLDLVPSSDRTLMFVLLIEAATPTAMNLQLLTDSLLAGQGSRGVARVIAVTYIASAITLTAWISIYLALIHGGAFDR